MGQCLPPDQMELYRRVDEVLHYLWDPIGIAGTPEARDEYHGYLPTVFKFLLEEADADAIRDYLLTVENDRMGLDLSENSRKRTDSVIHLLFRWRKIIINPSS